jgi:hypothetical protein
MWHKHCGKFMSHLEIGPASCLIDAMLEFATLAGSEQYDAAERDGVQESRELVADYERRLDEAFSRLADAEQDAARYRYLRSNFSNAHFLDFMRYVDQFDPVKGDEVDAAIDAAIEESRATGAQEP